MIGVIEVLIKINCLKKKKKYIVNRYIFYALKGIRFSNNDVSKGKTLK